MAHGFATQGGAGIAEGGRSLTLTGCVVRDDVASSTDIGVQGGGINAVGSLTVTDTTVSNNTLTGTSSTYSTLYGAGIYQTAGTITVTNSTISGNTINAPALAIGVGGGLISDGTPNVRGSTIRGNQVVGAGSALGGGLYIVNVVTTVTSSTIALNDAQTRGGGIYPEASLPLTDTLIAGNTDMSGNPDVYGAIAAPIAPKLDGSGLQANGSTGPKTIALLRTPPAIEAGGTCPSGITTDERGLPRAGNCDIFLLRADRPRKHKITPRDRMSPVPGERCASRVLAISDREC